MSKKDNDYDEISNVTGGVVNANTAATVAGIGGMAPGGLGVGFTAAEAGFSSYADAASTEKDAAFLAQRTGLDVQQLMHNSRLLNTEFVDMTGYGNLSRKLRSVGIAGAGALPGTWAGAAVGSAILPIGGTLFGGAIGGMAGGMFGGGVDRALFATDAPVNVSDSICAACSKQDNGQLSAKDVMQLVALKANDRDREFILQQVARTDTNGMGLDHVTEAYLGPLLGDDYFLNGEMNACQYIADQCNAGKIDIAEIALDEHNMQRRAPAQQQSAGAIASYDPSFDGNIPSGAPSLPSDLKSNGRNSKGSSYSTSA